MGLSLKLSASLFFISAAAFAQLPVSIGVKAGVPLTDSFSTTQIGSGIVGKSGDTSYLIGPTVELRLPFHLSVEADALYRPLTLTTSVTDTSSGTSITTNTSHDSHVWEFPILAKYHFKLPVVSPYVEAGPSFRTTGSLGYLSNNGVTFGVGTDIKALVLRVSPEFRYTHWSSDSKVNGFIPTGSKQDQVQFLVGFSF
jgi:hypothetical protein